MFAYCVIVFIMTEVDERIPTFTLTIRYFSFAAAEPQNPAADLPLLRLVVRDRLPSSRKNRNSGRLSVRLPECSLTGKAAMAIIKQREQVPGSSPGFPIGGWCDCHALAAVP